MRLSTFAALSLSLVVCISWLPACDDDTRQANLVQPVYADACQLLACAPHGECRVDGSGTPGCLCHVGYTGPTCTACEAGFHRDAHDRCISDKSCAEQIQDPCGENGDCVDDGGVIACMCQVGYEGPRCTLCAERYARDELDRCLPLFLTPNSRSDAAVSGPQSPVDAGVSCDPGYTGPQCTQCARGYHPFGRGCVADEQCGPESCPKSASCDVTQGVVECTCLPGYAGSRCADCATGYHAEAPVCVADQTCQSDSCPAHASCSVSGGKVVCPCDAGYAEPDCSKCAKGYHLEDGVCIQDTKCKELSCPARASCNDETGKPVCTCHEGYKGKDRCEECATGYHPVGDKGDCVKDETCEDHQCPERATCRVDAGIAGCDCHTGYDGPGCDICAEGYHLAGDGTCVPDEVCSETSCPVHSTCMVRQGVVHCVCDAGWSGEQCDQCAKATKLSDFETGDGWPTANDSCTTRPELVAGALTLRSREGAGSVLLCARSTYNGIMTRHVELEANAENPAQLTFATPVVSLAFDYGARLSPLSLEVLADGAVVGSIELAKKSKGSLRLEFSTGVRSIALRGRGLYAQGVGLDNITYQVGECE